jgi:hypothetical protein
MPKTMPDSTAEERYRWIKPLLGKKYQLRILPRAVHVLNGMPNIGYRVFSFRK